VESCGNLCLINTPPTKKKKKKKTKNEKSSSRDPISHAFGKRVLWLHINFKCWLFSYTSKNVLN
jgi:hypothetical protein